MLVENHCHCMSLKETKKKILVWKERKRAAMSIEIRALEAWNLSPRGDNVKLSTAITSFYCELPVTRLALF